MSIRKHTTSRPGPLPKPAGTKTARRSPSVKHRVLMVDDHPMTREGLAAIINRQADMEVCGQAGSPAGAMTELSKSKPDLMITDMTMPGRSGIEFIKDVHAMMPKLPVLVLSMHDEMLYAERALHAGARGYVMKDIGSARLLKVIRLLLKGQSCVSPQVAARLLDAVTAHSPRGSASPIAKLSDREFEVFQLLGQGKSTKEVAAALHLSPKTVDVHREHIKEKLKLKNALSLSYRAVCWVQAQATRSR